MCSASSPVHDLAVEGDAAQLQALLSGEGAGIALDQRDSFGFAPIHLATDRGQSSLIKVLVGKDTHAFSFAEQGTSRWSKSYLHMEPIRISRCDASHVAPILTSGADLAATLTA